MVSNEEWAVAPTTIQDNHAEIDILWAPENPGVVDVCLEAYYETRNVGMRIGPGGRYWFNPEIDVLYFNEFSLAAMHDNFLPAWKVSGLDRIQHVAISRQAIFQAGESPRGMIILQWHPRLHVHTLASYFPSIKSLGITVPSGADIVSAHRTASEYQLNLDAHPNALPAGACVHLQEVTDEMKYIFITPHHGEHFSINLVVAAAQLTHTLDDFLDEVYDDREQGVIHHQNDFLQALVGRRKPKARTLILRISKMGWL